MKDEKKDIVYVLGGGFLGLLVSVVIHKKLKFHYLVVGGIGGYLLSKEMYKIKQIKTPMIKKID